MSKHFLISVLGLVFLCRCSSSGSNSEIKDIPLSRNISLPGQETDGSTIVVDQNEQIEWQRFFEKAPSTKAREALLNELSVVDTNLNATQLLDRGRKMMALGQLINAETTLKLAMRKSSENPEILLALADVSMRKNQLNEANDYLITTKQMIDNMTEKNVSLVFRYRYQLAMSYLQQGKDKDAHAILTDLIKIEKKFAPAYVALSQSYLSKRKNDVAIFAAKRGLDRAGDTAALHNILALALQNSGNINEAKNHFEKALELEPEHVASLVNFSKLQMTLGAKESAELMLKRAVTFAPGDYASFFALGLCQKSLSQYKSARKSFERAIELNPQQASARFELAQLLHERLNERGEALRLFNEVAQLNDSRYNTLAQGYIKDIMAKGL